MGEIIFISPMPKPLCTKAIPAIMGEMRDFLKKVK
jgi:hypothetical protein